MALNYNQPTSLDLLSYQLAQQQQQQDLGDNPFYSAGTSLLKSPAPRIGDRKGSFLGSFLPAFAQPIIGGLARGFGQQQVERSYTDPGSGYLGLLAQAQNASPEDLQGIYASNPEFQKKFGAEIGLIGGLKKSQSANDIKEFAQKVIQSEISAGSQPSPELLAQAGLGNLEIGKVTPKYQRGDIFKAQGGASQAGSDIAQIQTNIPPVFQKEAIKEKGILESTYKIKQAVEDTFDKYSQLKTKDIYTPFSTAAAQAESLAASLKFNVAKLLGANPSDRDLKIIEQIIPQPYDTQDRLKVKKDQFVNFIEARSTATPTLREFTPQVYEKYSGITGQSSAQLPQNYDVAPRQQVPQATTSPPPGLNFQQFQTWKRQQGL